MPLALQRENSLKPTKCQRIIVNPALTQQFNNNNDPIIRPTLPTCQFFCGGNHSFACFKSPQCTNSPVHTGSKRSLFSMSLGNRKSLIVRNSDWFFSQSSLPEIDKSKKVSGKHLLTAFGYQFGALQMPNMSVDRRRNHQILSTTAFIAISEHLQQRLL